MESTALPGSLHGRGRVVSVEYYSSNLSMNPRTEYYDLTDDRALYEFFDRFFLDCQRWGEGADGAEYKSLAAAKNESVEKRAARMGLKTMAGLAAATGARSMAEIARG